MYKGIVHHEMDCIIHNVILIIKLTDLDEEYVSEIRQNWWHQRLHESCQALNYKSSNSVIQLSHLPTYL